MATRPPLKPAYLIHGSDRARVEVAVRRLRARVIDDGGQVETLSAVRGDDGGEPADADDAVGACNALGLLGGARLILVRDVQAWKAPAAQPVIDYLEAPAPDTVLALVATALPAGSKLPEAVAAAGDVLGYQLPEKRDMAAWLKTQADRAGVSIDAGGLKRLLELAGDEPSALQTEIDKLSLLAGDQTVTARTVDAVCVLERDLPPWDLTDALGSRQPGVALEMLGRFLDRRDGDVSRWLPALARHLRQLHAARLIVDQGGGSKDVAKRLGLKSEFPARKLCQQAGAWTPAELSAAIVRIALAERETRGEGQIRDRFALERALVEAIPARASR